MRMNVRLRLFYIIYSGLMQGVRTAEIDITTMHDLDGAKIGKEDIEAMNIVQLASATSIKLGTVPRGSSRVCTFTAAFVDRKRTHGNTERHKSTVFGSSA